MWAIEPVLAKLAYRKADFLETSAIRALFVALVAFSYALFTDPSGLKVERKRLPVLLYLAIAGTLVADLLYFLGIRYVPVINVVLIGHMQPFFIVLIGYLILRSDAPGPLDYVGITLMIASGFLVTTRSFENSRSGKIRRLYRNMMGWIPAPPESTPKIFKLRLSLRNSSLRALCYF